MMKNNIEMMKGVVSTCLHTTVINESRKLTHKEITDTAIRLRKCLSQLYPVTDKEWEYVLRDIARYADCLICSAAGRQSRQKGDVKMKKLPKHIQRLLEKVSIDRDSELTDSYIFSTTKYIKDESVINQAFQLVQWFEKQCGAHEFLMPILPGVFIKGDKKYVQFRLRLHGENKTLLTHIR